MKLKAGQAQPILVALAAVKAIHLPVKTSYWLARTATQLQPEVEAFEESRKKLLEQFGEHNEDGALVADDAGLVSFDDFDGFKAAFEELGEQEFEIKMEPLTLDGFAGKDGTALISTEIMAGLLPLIEEE